VRCGSAGGSEGLDPRPGESWLGRGRKEWLYGGEEGKRKREGEGEGEGQKVEGGEEKGCRKRKEEEGKGEGEERERREEIMEKEDKRGGEGRKR